MDVKCKVKPKVWSKNAERFVLITVIGKTESFSWWTLIDKKVKYPSTYTDMRGRKRKLNIWTAFWHGFYLHYSKVLIFFDEINDFYERLRDFFHWIKVAFCRLRSKTNKNYGRKSPLLSSFYKRSQKSVTQCRQTFR